MIFIFMVTLHPLTIYQIVLDKHLLKYGDSWMQKSCQKGIVIHPTKFFCRIGAYFDFLELDATVIAYTIGPIFDRVYEGFLIGTLLLGFHLFGMTLTKIIQPVK